MSNLYFSNHWIRIKFLIILSLIFLLYILEYLDNLY